MTLKELKDTLIQKRQGLAYEMWKLGTFITMGFAGEYPKTPQEGSPELFPPKPSIKMPSFLKERSD